jgi:hypothetical protein
MHIEDILLHESIKRFIAGKKLTHLELVKVRSYVWEYSIAMPTYPKDLNSVLSMDQEQLLRYITDVLLTFAIDPF